MNNSNVYSEPNQLAPSLSSMQIYHGYNNPNTVILPPRQHPKLKGYTLPTRQIKNLPFPKINKLANRLSSSMAMPYDMMLHGILASATFCVQGVADVFVPGGWTSPTSGVFMLAAPSAAGKTPLEKALFSVPSELEDTLLSKKLGGDFDPDDNNRPLIMIDDVTGTAMIDNLRKVGSAGLISTEAANSLTKLDMQAITAINTLHDGNPLRSSRGGPNGYSIKIEDVKLMMYMGLQDGVLDTILETKKGKAWIDVGSLNRVVFCRPKIDYTAKPNYAEPDNGELDAFQSRQAELLLQSYARDNVRQLVKFNQEACDYWKVLSDWLRSKCAPGEYFHAVSGHATKLRDIIPRIAAVIHVFEGFEGDITRETLVAASEIVLHYADYHVAQFSQIPQSIYDAEELFEILRERFYSCHGAFIFPEQRYVYLEVVKNILPSRLKKPDRLHDALIALTQQGRIGVCWLRSEKSNTRKRYVDLFPLWTISPPLGLIFDGYVI